jgi:hypothetical protein
MTVPRAFSQAISEGDGISLIAEVGDGGAAHRAEEEGAEALLVEGGDEQRLREIRAASSLPILLHSGGERTDAPAGADACVVGVAGAGADERLEHAYRDLSEDFELVFRIDHEDQLAELLERYDPEIFLLAAPAGDEGEALERVLELLPDIPAGKLAVAEIDVTSRDEIAELERAGVDAVIVGTDNVASLVGAAPPEV